jgi:hypothetical protein
MEGTPDGRRWKALEAAMEGRWKGDGRPFFGDGRAMENKNWPFCAILLRGPDKLPSLFRGWPFRLIDDFSYA